MGVFYGRESELAELEYCYSRGGAVLIYGRRRIGKTYMIEHFCEGKRALFLRCVRGSVNENLEVFAQTIAVMRGTQCRDYSGFLDFFNELGEVCTEGRTVIVIDEYQFLTKGKKSADSYTQHFIDSVIAHSDSMIILCGSSVSAMRAKGKDGGNPLFGRFRRIIEMGPMSFDECSMFHPGMPDGDRLRLFLTVGGIPRYHDELSQDTYRGCIVGNYLENKWMLEEPQALIDSEFSHGDRISAVISAISGGSTNLKEISEKIGEDDSVCTLDLKQLCDTGIVGKLNPMLDAPKHPKYFVRDDLFAFNHEVLLRRRALVDMRDAEAAYDVLDPFIRTFLGRRFEYFCADLVRRSYPVTEIGSWWKGGKNQPQDDIDIVARVRTGRGNAVLLAECKFTKSPVGFHEYNVLESRAERFMGDYNGRLMMFSASGFERDLEEFAEGAGVLLAGPDEILGRRPLPAIL